MPHNSSKPPVEIHELIHGRWSPKTFDPEIMVGRGDLLSLLEAARWAPSSYNAQPWRFIICDRASDEENWRKALSTLFEKNQEWARNAPVLILAVAMERFQHNGQANRCALYDTGAASLSLALQATALGLVTHQMGGFDTDKARLMFGLPEDCQAIAMIAVGYLAAQGIADEISSVTQFADRVRAPLNERFFLGEWGRRIE